MNIFISQPLFEKKTEEILMKRQMIIEDLWKEYDNDIDILDNFSVFSHNLNPFDYLSNNLKKMKDADIVYFTKEWEKSKTCQIEHQCAIVYQLPIKYEKNISIKKGCGIVNIAYDSGKIVVNGVNTSADVLFLFSQFKPLILSSSSNKNKTINFKLAVLPKYENILLSHKFKEICQKKNMKMNIDISNKKELDGLFAIFNGQEQFRKIIERKEL